MDEDSYIHNTVVRATDREGRQFTVVPHCALCGELHTHGYAREIFEGGEKQHKIAHCGPQEQHERVDEDAYIIYSDDEGWYNLIHGDCGSGSIVLKRKTETKSRQLELEKEVELEPELEPDVEDEVEFPTGPEFGGGE